MDVVFRVARLYITVEQKQLEYESAVKKLEEMEPTYFEQKEVFEGVSAELMRAKEEYAWCVRESEQARLVRIRTPLCLCWESCFRT